jgi:hypothetical protein
MTLKIRATRCPWVRLIWTKFMQNWANDSQSFRPRFGKSGPE